MYLVVHGSEFRKARKKISSILSGLEKKRPDAEYFALDDESFSAVQFEELMGGQGLFERKSIVLLDNVFSSKDGKEVVMDRCAEMKESENVFILYEPALTKKDLTKLSKHAYQVYEFSENKRKSSEYKPFGLSDALGKRSVKEAWNELQRAWIAEKKPEEIHGLLFWQVKSMIVASSSQTAEQAEMKSFVYGKSKKAARNYSETELQNLSRDLVERYHRARRGEGDLTRHIEEFVLELKSDMKR